MTPFAVAIAIVLASSSASAVVADIPALRQLGFGSPPPWHVKYHDECGTPSAVVLLPMVQVRQGVFCLLRRSDGVGLCESARPVDIDANVQPLTPPTNPFPMAAIDCSGKATHGLLLLIYPGNSCSPIFLRHQIDILAAEARDAKEAIAKFLRREIRSDPHKPGLVECRN